MYQDICGSVFFTMLCIHGFPHVMFKRDMSVHACTVVQIHIHLPLQMLQVWS